MEIVLRCTTSPADVGDVTTDARIALLKDGAAPARILSSGTTLSRKSQLLQVYTGC
jgi:hypothetical protein